MRISDWSSDVCSSDLLDDATGEVVASDRASGELGYVAPVGRRSAPARRVEADPAPSPVVPTSGTGFRESTTTPPTSRSAKERAKAASAMHKAAAKRRSEEHTAELQSLMRTSYAVFCLKKKK